MAQPRRSESDFMQTVRGEITAEEYVQRLEERVNQRQRENAPMRSAKDVVARYFPPQSFRICRRCRGTGVGR